MKHDYIITEMTCSSCKEKLAKEFNKLKDVQKLSFDLDNKKVSITMSKHIDTEVLDKAAKKAGNYSVKESNSFQMSKKETSLKDFAPLIAVFSYVILTAFLYTLITGPHINNLMHGFMGSFFLYFSLFKMLDIAGFAQGYSTYDVIAKRVYVYGYLFPFIELSLAVIFLLQFTTPVILYATAILMLISAFGVAKNLLKNSNFKCACLGTVLNVPLTKISLFENLLMAAMAIIMVVI